MEVIIGRVCQDTGEGILYGIVRVEVSAFRGYALIGFWDTRRRRVDYALSSDQSINLLMRVAPHVARRTGLGKQCISA